MNSNIYPLKNTNSHHLLLNTTITPLCNSKISLIFLWGIIFFPIMFLVAKAICYCQWKSKFTKCLLEKVVLNENIILLSRWKYHISRFLLQHLKILHNLGPHETDNCLSREHCKTYTLLWSNTGKFFQATYKRYPQ